MHGSRITGAAIGMALGLWCGAGVAAPPQLEAAVEAACDLDARGTIVSPLEHAEGAEQDALILELTADWMPRFNRFADGGDAWLLRAFAEGAAAATGDAYGAEACRVLEPLANLSIAASIVRGAGATLSPGAVLDGCKDGLCMPPAVRAVFERCDITGLALPISHNCQETRQ